MENYRTVKAVHFFPALDRSSAEPRYCDIGLIFFGTLIILLLNYTPALEGADYINTGIYF